VGLKPALEDPHTACFLCLPKQTHLIQLSITWVIHQDRFENNSTVCPLFNKHANKLYFYLVQTKEQNNLYFKIMNGYIIFQYLYVIFRSLECVCVCVFCVVHQLKSVIFLYHVLMTVRVWRQVPPTCCAAVMCCFSWETSCKTYSALLTTAI